MARRQRKLAYKAAALGALASVALTVTGGPGALAATTLPDLPNLGIADLSFVTPNVALTQAQQAAASLLATVGNATTLTANLGNAVSVSVVPALSGVVTSLKAGATQIITDLTALNAAGAGTDVSDLAAQLQTDISAVAGVLESVGLSQALGIAQQVLSPVCSLAALPNSPVAGVGVDWTRVNSLAAPIADTTAAIDATVAAAYKSVYTEINTLATQLLGPTAAILQLLETNIHTVYYPPNGGAPVVRDTPALLQVPTPVDVDGQPGFDACVVLSLGANNAIVQQVTKMPLANPVLPVDINVQLLGLINFTTAFKGSTLPISFNSTRSSGAKATTITDNTYSINRGATLPLPPVLGVGTTVNSLLGGGTTPIPSMTQSLGISTASLTASLYSRYVNYPGHTTVTTSSGQKAAAAVPPSASNPSGTPAKEAWPAITKYVADGNADSFASGTDAGALLHSETKFTPAPVQAQTCSIGTGECANAPAALKALETQSFGFQASSSVKVDAFATSSLLPPPLGGDGTNCGVASLGDLHYSGKTLYLAVGTSNSAPSTNHVYADTNGVAAGPASPGCISVTGFNGAIPTGFSALARVGSYHNGLTLGTVDTKTGTAFCPAGTTFTGFAAICPTPVVPGAVTISGQPYIGSTLTATPAGWAPGAPNAPTYTYQWQQCDGAGANCASIAGATSNTYTPAAATIPANSVDIGHKLQVVVTGRNADSSSAVTSAPTAVITLPPAPVNTVAPKITITPTTATHTSGKTLTGTSGTWANGTQFGDTNGQFHYQWFDCDSTGAVCSPATGPGADVLSAATTSTYTTVASDEGKYVTLKVTASNLGGDVTASSLAFYILGTPTNTVAPTIVTGDTSTGSDRSGVTVQSGDHLSVKDGTWVDTKTLSYQWLTCDPSNTCTPLLIGTTPVTAKKYTVQDSDIGNTLEVKVTGTNDNLVGNTASATTAATGVVIPNNQKIRGGAAIPDGPVYATAAKDNNTSYVGGSFDTVGTFTGNVGAIAANATSTSTGTPVAFAPQLTGGAVKTITGDGAGGFFYGGSFTKAGGIACKSLAHYTLSGTAYSLDPAYCGLGINGEVRSLDRSKSTVTDKLLAVGGSFTQGGHSNLIFIDTTTVTPVYLTGGDPNAAVNSVVDSGTTTATIYYFGGDFSTIGGTAAGALAAANVAGADLSSVTITRSTTFTAGVCKTGTQAVADCSAGPGGASVKMITAPVLGIFVLGSFDHLYAGTTTTAITTAAVRNNAAAIASAGTSVQAWNPNINGTVYALAGVPTGGTTALGSLGPYAVYLGGSFTSVNGVSGFSNLAEFGYTLTGGNSTTAAGLGNSAPNTSFKPQLDGPVYSLSNVTSGVSPADGSSTMYVGGDFKNVNGQARNRLAAFKLSAYTGNVPPALSSTWTPAAGGTVYAVPNDGVNVVIGGAFNVVGGTIHNNIVEISNAVGGQPTTWSGSVTGCSGASCVAAVRSIAYANGNVYIGGDFTTSGGLGRNNAAAIDAVTGATTAWNPNADGTVRTIAVSGSTAYLGGSFANAGGAVRSHVASVDASTGVANLSWNPGATGTVNAIVVNGSTVYFAGSAGSVNAVNAATGTPVAGFASTTDGVINALLVGPTGLYVGGDFTTINAATHHDVAQVDPATGAVLSWDPDIDGAVKSMAFSVSTLYLGGDFTQAGASSATPTLRAHLAAVFNDDASLSGFDPSPDATVNALSAAPNSTLTVGGVFTGINNVLSPNLAFFGA